MLMPATASASQAQESMLQDDGALQRDPAGTLQAARNLGVDRVRVGMRWSLIAPKPNSRRRPHGFKSADPGAYPNRVWGPFDSIVTTAQTDGISLNLDLAGGAPLWATAPGAPAGSARSNWAPSPGEFQAFVRAVGTRYSGNYDPTTKSLRPGNPHDLPAVHFWSIWNEPNYGPSLAPQGVPGNLTVEESPRLYRGLVDAAWTGLHQSGHGRDQVLVGEIAPRGYDNFGLFSGMRPLQFLRALYCVDAGYHPLRGSAAAQRSCPRTAAVSRAFRRAHPGLFEASGFADHPYSRWFPPNVERPNNPDYTSLADIRFLERGLDRLQRVYGSGKRFPIFNTEYGYITSPPKHPTRRIPYISTTTAAQFLNQAEYMSWRDPRIKSFTQYLLADPLPATRSNDYGGFASGLLTFNQRPKPTYDAWRLPLFLPVTTARRGRSLEVWGCARPVFFARQDDPATPQTVQIQFKRDSGGGFTTLRNVAVTNQFGYFDTRISPPSSGRIRLTWTYPPGDPLLSPGTTAHSRSVQISVS
ncbi:MAG: hypothetical protein ACR2JH_02200 [Solirubrobacteraceae bacterium]